jgi:hypothetical protein
MYFYHRFQVCIDVCTSRRACIEEAAWQRRPIYVVQKFQGYFDDCPRDRWLILHLRKYPSLCSEMDKSSEFSGRTSGSKLSGSKLSGTPSLPVRLLLHSEVGGVFGGRAVHAASHRSEFGQRRRIGGGHTATERVSACVAWIVRHTCDLFKPLSVVSRAFLFIHTKAMFVQPLSVIRLLHRDET